MKPGGDDYTNRLLSFLKYKLNDPGATLKPLKEGKWVLKCNGRKWFVKRFPNQLRFIQQERLIQALLKENFPHVLPFHPIHQREFLLFDNAPIGITVWLETDYSMSYEHKKDREDALKVLKKFHEITGRLSGKWVETIPRHKWLKKWKKRIQQFEYNIPFIQAFIQPYYLYTFLEWGKWALEELKRLELPENALCITHGDVAHHNFLRGKNRHVYLIDFDLISISHPLTDDLQYCNRILPYIECSLSNLKNQTELQIYHNNLIFYLGLMYPTDVFREWNRFIREDQNYKQRVWGYLMNLTVHQFPKRMYFNQQLHQEVNRIHSQL